MIESFKTIRQQAEAEVTEKKSKFIGHAKPVETEEAAIEFLESVRKKHYTASHNVFAYTIGHNGFCRYSDDGEPSGTAGMPVLNILKSENITNSIIVVTRYFGGTLLGTGGLLRAYQAAAKAALSSAGIIEKSLLQKISLVCSYGLSGKIKHSLSESGAIILDTVYSDNVEFILLIVVSDTKRFLKTICEISSDTIKPKLLEQTYLSL